MQDSRLPKLVFCLLAAALAARFLLDYPKLPATMASHFNAAGIPNGWQPKSVFFTVMSVAMALAAFVTFVVPRIIANKPSEKINLPNKEYWLAPERRKATFEFFSAQMAWFGCALLFVLGCGFHYSIQANLQPQPHFDSASFLYVLVAFFIFLLFWLIRFFRNFARLPQSDSLSK